MSVLVFAETSEGKFKKSCFEVISYGNKVAEQLKTNLVVLTINAQDTSLLYDYGAQKVLHIKNEQLNNFNAQIYTNILQQVTEKEQSKVLIFESYANSLYIAPMVAAKLNAGYASNVVALPNSTSPFNVNRKAFSNKAINHIQINSPIKVISLSKNSFGVLENKVEGITEKYSPSIIETNLIPEKTEKTSGKVTIADADIVVSGGRGLKGPENWGMIEELADVLGAATACSKPVSDLGWRPHSEHVGQTGKPVAANLYIAIGISGAIQHLAGVNSSKVKVVINTDAEAPFFKAADYGIVGDAFEVVPKLIEKLKEFKATNV